MAERSNADERRRALLVRALAAGAYAVAAPLAADILGGRPAPLPAGRSIYLLDGEVTVNGVPATLDTPIRAGDRVVTKAGGRVVFVVGQDAFILRGGSELELAPAPREFMVEALRLVTGKLLSVFGKTRHQVRTPVATIGIRGTGLYVESEPDRSYVCTCYGETVIGAADDATVSETVVSRHHDAARYVLAGGSERLRAAPFVNHTDDELSLIEALVGRTPPFVLPGDSYSTPRRGDY